MLLRQRPPHAIVRTMMCLGLIDRHRGTVDVGAAISSRDRLHAIISDTEGAVHHPEHNFWTLGMKRRKSARECRSSPIAGMDDRL